MIRLYFETIDGIRKVKIFKTLKGARKAAHDWVGKNADVGRWYAVSTDGVVKVSTHGCTLAELFGDELLAPTPVSADKKFVAIRKSGDCYELYSGEVCPMNLFGKAFKVLDKVTGDHDDGWALKGRGGAYDAPLDTDVHYPTLQAALAEAKSAYLGWQSYLNDEAAAERHAEGAWLRHAEMGSVASQHEEDYERRREAAFA